MRQEPNDGTICCESARGRRFDEWWYKRKRKISIDCFWCDVGLLAHQACKLVGSWPAIRPFCSAESSATINISLFRQWMSKHIVSRYRFKTLFLCCLGFWVVLSERLVTASQAPGWLIFGNCPHVNQSNLSLIPKWIFPLKSCTSSRL